MSYLEGDYVVPSDLPRGFVCRVVSSAMAVEPDVHLLELEPLEGPWRLGTRLIRLDHDVRLAAHEEIGRVEAWVGAA